MISVSREKADVNILDELILEPGAFYVMDRAYVDFAAPTYRFVSAGAFFCYASQGRTADQPAGVATGEGKHRCPQRPNRIWLTLPKSLEHYPDRFRRISYRDPETDKVLVFLTNNFDLPALTIAQLYKSRWRAELFFKWIKQNLRIKHFFGTSYTSQDASVDCSSAASVLVAIVRKELKLELSLSQILQVLSVNVFEQVPLAELVAKTATQNETLDSRNQLMLWH